MLVNAAIVIILEVVTTGVTTIAITIVTTIEGAGEDTDIEMKRNIIPHPSELFTFIRQVSDRVCIELQINHTNGKLVNLLYCTCTILVFKLFKLN